MWTLFDLKLTNYLLNIPVYLVEQNNIKKPEKGKSSLEDRFKCTDKKLTVAS
jgi:hypothetical protein